MLAPAPCRTDARGPRTAVTMPSHPSGGDPPVRIRLLSIAAVAALAIGTFAAPAAAGTPRTWYVDDDGTSGVAGCTGGKPVPSVIQDAIDGAAAGDTVLVCPGAYRANVTVDKKGL